MKEYNPVRTLPSNERPLLTELLELLEAHRGAFQQQRTFMRGEALVLADLFTFGRKTMTQRLVSGGRPSRIGVRGIGC